MTIPLTPDAIIQAAATVLGTTVTDITRPDGRRVTLAPGEHPRSWIPTEARRCAMFLIRTHLDLSFQQIGDHFNRSRNGTHAAIQHVAARVDAGDEPTIERLKAIRTAATERPPHE